MRKMVIVSALLMLVLMSTTAQADDARVVATICGTDLGQGEGGGGPLYEDGTAGGVFAISLLDGALIFTVSLDSWHYADAAHVIACGQLNVIRNEFGIYLPAYVCTTPVPVSGGPVFTDFDGDGHADHMEWVNLLD